MPRFYFHLIDDFDAPDQGGVELPGLEAAREHAKRVALFTAAEPLREEGKLVLDHRVDIEDGDGTVLDTVLFNDIVAVR